MKKSPAVALLLLISGAACAGPPDRVTTHPAAGALLRRLDAVRTAEVAYHEDVVTTRADAFRGAPSTVEFYAKADRATSSGYALTVMRTGRNETAMWIEIRGGTARQYSLSSAGGTWQAGPDVMVMSDVDPVTLALGFLYREVLPAVASGVPALSPVRVDGATADLETITLSDADSETVVFTKETGLLRFEGKSPRYSVREDIDEFRRDGALGLVPVRRTLYSKMRGFAETDSRLTLKDLRVNDPSFTLAGDENTSASILRRFRAD